MDFFISSFRKGGYRISYRYLVLVYLSSSKKSSWSTFGNNSFPTFPCQFSSEVDGVRMREGWGKRKIQWGQKQVSERADLDVDGNWKKRDIVRAAPDRKASQSAHSASLSPFLSTICSSAFFFPSVSSSSKGLRVISVDSRCNKVLRANDVRVEINLSVKKIPSSYSKLRYQTLIIRIVRQWLRQ